MKKRIKKKRVNGWVFVKEGLPKETKFYLVQWENGYITTDLFSVIENAFGDKKAVAWREMPAPPIKGVLMY